MTTMSEQSIRNGALLKSGTLSPNPWDLTLSGQNVWRYTGATRTEVRAPQGCAPSAASSAGMARAAARLRPPQNTQIPTRPRLTYCGPHLVLTEGSTLLMQTTVRTNSLEFDGSTPRARNLPSRRRWTLPVAMDRSRKIERFATGPVTSRTRTHTENSPQLNIRPNCRPENN